LFQCILIGFSPGCRVVEPVLWLKKYELRALKLLRRRARKFGWSKGNYLPPARSEHGNGARWSGSDHRAFDVRYALNSGMKADIARGSSASDPVSRSVGDPRT